MGWGLASALSLRPGLASKWSLDTPGVSKSLLTAAGARVLTCLSECFSFRGHKRKLSEEDVASESSRASSCEDEEGSSSEADEMAAALEAELDLV